jgi:hypothetical protein
MGQFVINVDDQLLLSSGCASTNIILNDFLGEKYLSRLGK